LKIDVCNDLHVDRHKHVTKLYSPDGPKILDDFGNYMHFDFMFHKNNSDVLCISGDISDNIKDVSEVINEACKYYDMVIMVDGNHEFHGNIGNKSIPDTMNELSHLKNNNSNFVYLDGIYQTRFDINNIAFIGGNCWYDWKCFQHKGISMIDAYASWDDKATDNKLDFGSYTYPNVLGAEQINNIQEELRIAQNDSSVESIVMITHTAPLHECLKWTGEKSFDAMSPSYCNSELRDIFDEGFDKIKYWLYGHTHNRTQLEYNGIKLINNAYGYPKENLGKWSMVQIEV
jgi:Icc-related predicted phosphoesterase